MAPQVSAALTRRARGCTCHSLLLDLVRSSGEDLVDLSLVPDLRFLVLEFFYRSETWLSGKIGSTIPLVARAWFSLSVYRSWRRTQNRWLICSITSRVGHPVRPERIPAHVSILPLRSPVVITSHHGGRPQVCRRRRRLHPDIAGHGCPRTMTVCWQIHLRPAPTSSRSRP